MSGREVEEYHNPILNREDPFSVYNMVSTRFQQALLAVPSNFWGKSVEDLESEGNISATDRKIRVSFWVEHERAVRTKSNININNIVKGVVPPAYFYAKVVSNSYRVAYILSPPEDYRNQLEEMLVLGNQELRKILEVGNYTKDKYGNDVFDSKLAAVKEKIVTNISNRLKGMPINRSMQVTHAYNENVNHNPAEALSRETMPDFSQLNPTELKKLVGDVKEGRYRQPIDVNGDKDE
mgnify:CR=1 FL=1